MTAAALVLTPEIPALWPARRAALVRLGSRTIKQAMAAPTALGTDQEQRFADLIARVARHQDRAAFAVLFGHFAPRVKAYLMRLGADDGSAQELAQEVMLALWRRAASFNPALASVGTWVFTIARNKRIDRLRRERRPEIDPDDPALAPDPAIGADVALDSAQTGDRLRTAIANLPEEQAALLRMAYFEDKSHSTIAAETRLPLGTVKSRIRLALGRLRGVLESA
jgi:RNA polymerase sigma-70 factor (ECF subfamily)